MLGLAAPYPWRPRPVPADGMPKRLHGRRIWFELNATRLSYEEASFHARVEAPSGTSYMPDGGGGRIVNGLVRLGPF
jgi:hypothetical protein